MTSDTLLSQY